MDPVIGRRREEISELDGKILEALNARIALVKDLKDYKEAQGLGFHDSAQEDRVIAHLRQRNGGPLSEASLDAIFRLILECVKQDAARLP